MMLGVPGAGKSYFASRLCYVMGFEHLDSGTIGRDLFGQDDFDSQQTAELLRTIRRRANRALREGGSVVRDCMHLTRRERHNARAAADEVGALSVLVWVTAPDDVVVERNLKRLSPDARASVEGRLMAVDTVRDFKKLTQPPQPDEPHVVIDGRWDFAQRQFPLFVERCLDPSTFGQGPSSRP